MCLKLSSLWFERTSSWDSGAGVNAAVEGLAIGAAADSVFGRYSPCSVNIEAGEYSQGLIPTMDGGINVGTYIAGGWKMEHLSKSNREDGRKKQVMRRKNKRTLFINICVCGSAHVFRRLSLRLWFPTLVSREAAMHTLTSRQRKEKLCTGEARQERNGDELTKRGGDYRS